MAPESTAGGPMTPSPEGTELAPPGATTGAASDATGDRVGGPFSGVRASLRDTVALDAWRFATSLVGAARLRSVFRDVQVYCLFVGHGRSGHSIVGSLIDAHPEAVVSDELDAARFITRGFLRDQVLALSVDRSAR